jgi:hypothetical protein
MVDISLEAFPNCHFRLHWNSRSHSHFYLYFDFHPDFDFNWYQTAQIDEDCLNLLTEISNRWNISFKQSRWIIWWQSSLASNLICFMLWNRVRHLNIKTHQEWRVTNKEEWMTNNESWIMNDEGGISISAIRFQFQFQCRQILLDRYRLFLMKQNIDQSFELIRIINIEQSRRIKFDISNECHQTMK